MRVAYGAVVAAGAEPCARADIDRARNMADTNMVMRQSCGIDIGWWGSGEAHGCWSGHAPTLARSAPTVRTIRLAA